MPDVRRYCFEHRARSRATLRSVVFGPALLCLAVLSGCNASKTLDVASTGNVEAPLAAADGGKVSAAKGKALAPVADDQAGAGDERVVTGSVAQPENKTAPPQKNAKAKTNLDKRTTGSIDRDVQLTPRCRYVLAMAGVDTALLRSPTLSAEANDEGDLGANISYDVLDLRRANLKEKIALAQCRRNYAQSKLTQLLATSSQALTRAGYLAQASYLESRSTEFKRIRRKIRKSVREGSMTQPRATGLYQFLQQVQSVASKARGEAARREVIDAVQHEDVAGLDQQLVEADREIQVLQRKLRTTDAFQLSLSGGYSVRSSQDDATLADTGNTYAKVKASFRLGALGGKRRAFEDEALRAREDSLHQHGSGIFWRGGEISRANVRAIASLTA